ncbi:ABC transporter permease [Agromyces sp. SYSU T00194]|uniref:ABC transporter permease n=1 Tax=Agromyces chitinivorans TaxID=3158560 RepID=UPI0033943D7D
MVTTLIPVRTATERPVGRRFPTKKLLGLIPLAVLVVVAVVGPLVVPFDPTKVAGAAYLPPGAEHWFGTDSAGLDVYSRTIAATGLNVFIGVMVALLATAIGIVIGVVLGLNEPASGFRGMAARGLSRAVDLLQSVPAILVGVVAVAFYGAEVASITIAVAVILAPIQIRLVRTETLRVRSEGYVDAARIAGAIGPEVAVRHVLPNSLGPALQNSSVIFGLAVIVTAGLGFIGVGLAPPTAEWGAMLSRGAADALVGNWWAAAFPATALALTVATVAWTMRVLTTPSE